MKRKPVPNKRVRNISAYTGSVCIYVVLEHELRSLACADQGANTDHDTHTRVTRKSHKPKEIWWGCSMDLWHFLVIRVHDKEAKEIKRNGGDSSQETDWMRC